MNETLNIILAFAAGVLLGAIFFGGLWWTVKNAVSSKRSAFWFTGSLVVRSAIVLIGFYFIGHDHWQRMLVGLSGFIIARFIVMRLRLQAAKSSPMKQKADHAS